MSKVQMPCPAVYAYALNWADNDEQSAVIVVNYATAFHVFPTLAEAQRFAASEAESLRCPVIGHSPF